MNQRFDFLFAGDPAAIEAIYQAYLRDANAIDPQWRAFFEGFDFAASSNVVRSASGGVAATFASTATAAKSASGGATSNTAGLTTSERKEMAVWRLIDAYRLRGHLFTRTNPVRKRRQYRPTLDLENFDLSANDLDTVFAGGAEVGLGPAKLRDIVQLLDQTYCQSIGVEYRYVDDTNMVQWLQTRMESTRNRPSFATDAQHTILQNLNHAVQFEKFLHTKFVGQKRFSLEGAEALIPALEALLLTASEMGARECVMGMSHRGRLTVLTNVLAKPYETVFAEFQGKSPYDANAPFDGDVKYHIGHNGDRVLPNGEKMHLSLAPNPSHLEAVDPLVEGVARAKLDRDYESDTNKLVPILIHGDAALAGQGIVYEVVQMSQLRGFRTGGTIHIVVNNQLGFTTNFIDGRSSIYCTDVGKVTRSPILHVNGDDVEAVVFAMQLATEFRQRFHRDVFIDLLCYRRYGHNEADEPRFTQPILYKIIEQHPNAYEIYKQKLVSEKIVTESDAVVREKEFWNDLSARYDTVQQTAQPPAINSYLEGNWKGLRLATDADFVHSPPTGVEAGVLTHVGKEIFTIPDSVNCFPKIRKLFEERRKQVETGTALEWGVAELLAYGTLLRDGYGVRVSGQDVERGTFAHRHAVITIDDSVETYVPLHHVSESHASFEIYNSHLSEYGVMGFEFGYALANPRTLVIWEAQFGDFANGAQTIIDQFLCSSETKWQRMNGLTLLLPHGCEGQGPEHSSARMERFLELSANNNMQVVCASTPANLFHALRRQMLRDFRKPLVMFTPKSLLRHPECVSSLADLSTGAFREVIDDANVDPKKVQRVLLCTGKIYYELSAQRKTLQRTDVALVRIEQLFPVPTVQLAELWARYATAREWIWVQEEPQNLGAWPFWLRKWDGPKLSVVARKENASPATGYHQLHVQQQQELVARAFASDAVSKVRAIR